jgi:hypothetical protein
MPEGDAEPTVPELVLGDLLAEDAADRPRREAEARAYFPRKEKR